MEGITWDLNSSAYFVGNDLRGSSFTPSSIIVESYSETILVNYNALWGCQKYLFDLINPLKDIFSQYRWTAWCLKNCNFIPSCWISLPQKCRYDFTFNFLGNIFCLRHFTVAKPIVHFQECPNQAWRLIILHIPFQCLKFIFNLHWYYLRKKYELFIALFLNVCSGAHDVGKFHEMAYF